MKKLNRDIVSVLAGKLTKSESTIKKDIYILRSNYPKATLNAVAQLYARSYGYTVFKKLDKDDRNSMPNMQIQKESIVIKQKIKKTKANSNKIITFINYESDDYLTKEHISELNKAYTHKCYTCVSILLRKIIENKLIDILRHKFPPTSKENKELYFDIAQKRFKDLEIVIKNIRKKSSDFGVDKKLVERIADLTGILKNKANDNTHSWFHIIKNKAEIQEVHPQMVFELIFKLEKNIGIR